MAKKIIVGNWKMNAETLEKAQEVARETRAVAGKLANSDVVVCPPFPFIHAAGSKTQPDNYYLGSQSASIFENGSHTGEVGAKMLADIGAKYAIVGHSEARAAWDTDETVSKRIQRVLEAGLTAIVCVGENTRSEDGEHLTFVTAQMKATFAGVPADKAKKIIVAYEPVWAIGAKAAMQPEQIYEMSLFVKKVFADIFGPEAGLRVKVLYGGSANASNAAEIMQIGKVDGLLVGRESVNPPGFAELMKAVDAVK